MREGWTYKKLGEVCAHKKSIMRANNHLGPNDLIKYIDISSIDNSKNVIVSSTPYVLCDAPSRAQQIVEKGDVLISLVRPNLKNVAIVLSDDNKLVASSGFCVLRAKNIINNRYVFYIVRGEKFTNYLLRRVQGANYPAVREEDVKGYDIPVPPLSEQQRIVSELDLLSGIIEKKKAQLKEYDQLAQSIFYDMFGNLLEAIPTTTLKEVASYYIGLTYKPTDVSEKGTIVLRSSNIQNNLLDFADTVRVNLNVGENKIVKDGDILMCARNGSARLVGKVARIKNIEEKMSFGAFMTIIRSDYNDYLFHFFLSDFFRNQLLTSKTATINQITSKMLDNIKLNVPPLSLQQFFASKIEAIERQKALVQQSITETETLFNSRMDYWFS